MSTIHKITNSGMPEGWKGFIIAYEAVICIAVLLFLAFAAHVVYVTGGLVPKSERKLLLLLFRPGWLEKTILTKMAYQDDLTGLPNRHAMNRFFESIEDGGRTMAVLFLDLDQFKAINDTLGHHVGDLLVREAGRRLGAFMNNMQQVFRLGGDEFLIVSADADRLYAEQLAHNVLHAIRMPFQLEEHELYVTSSIGISIGQVQKENRHMLLKQADTAMYRAKKNGKSQYCVYDSQIGAEEERKLELEKDLQRALARREFYLEFQPKWDVQANRLAGLEALVRWKHPKLGVVSPKEFIPVAEETGFIIPLTKRILEEACLQCRAWQDNGIYQSVSVNLSARLFRSDLLVDMVSSALQETGLDPEWLELELNEAAVLYQMDEAIVQLNRLRALGVRLSLDDFGTGSSSIGLLDRVRIHALKLDRLFTSDIAEPGKRAIVQALLQMAEQLRFEVVAEGVETPEHMALLQELGCRVMQGYYYSKPMPAAELEEWLRQPRQDSEDEDAAAAAAAGGI